MIDEHKRKWLDRNGYKPITDDVIGEWVWHQEANSRYLSERFEDAKIKFTHYKRYGKTIILYSTDYLSTKSLQELKQANRRMIKWHVVDEMWPVKEVKILIHNISLLWRRIRLRMNR